jgi:hypothetical protein
MLGTPIAHKALAPGYHRRQRHAHPGKSAEVRLHLAHVVQQRGRHHLPRYRRPVALQRLYGTTGNGEPMPAVGA